MAETEEIKEIEEFDFDTKNGKPKGNSGGRPTTEFLEQKQALEDLEALNRRYPGIAADFLREFSEGRKNGSKKTIRGDLEGIKDKVDGFLGSNLFKAFLGKPAAVTGFIAAQWTAEEYLKLPIQREVEVEVDDLTRPIFETRFVDDPRGGAGVGGSPTSRTEQVQVGFQQKKEIQNVTEYVQYPQFLHTILKTLEAILIAISGLKSFSDGIKTFVTPDRKTGNTIGDFILSIGKVLQPGSGF